MKNISFLPENFQFLEVKFSLYLNRRVFVMQCVNFINYWDWLIIRNGRGLLIYSA